MGEYHRTFEKGKWLERPLRHLKLFLGRLAALALPWSRRSHWRSHHAPYTLTQNIFWVESRQRHTVRNLRCEISCPNGEKKVVSAAMPYEVLAPKDISGPVELPPCGPGIYRLRWMMDAENRAKPILLAKDRWREGSDPRSHCGATDQRAQFRSAPRNRPCE